MSPSGRGGLKGEEERQGGKQVLKKMKLLQK